MVTIQTVDAQALFTKKLIAVYQDRPKPTAFLRSFFPDAPPTDTLELSIQVQRNGEKIAVDVLRGTDGNMNQMEKSTEKIFVPPYFREYFSHEAMSAYETMFRATEVSDVAFARLINSTADHVLELQEKIERSYELQCGQIFESGIVTINAGTNIDFKRKGASKVDVSGSAPWTTGGTDVFAQIQAGCVFLRKTGKIQTHSFDMLCGENAIAALTANTTFLNRQNLFHMQLDQVMVPQKNAVGGVYHGTLTAGPYRVNVWSYPEYYEDPTNSNTLTPYLSANKVHIMPNNPKFSMGFAMTPQLLEPGEQPTIGKFIISEFVDRKARTREFHVESAGLAIPTAVDQLYSLTVR